MALTGPRREHEQDAGSVIGRDGVTLVGVEEKEASRAAVDGLAAGFNTDVTVDNRDEGTFLHLVVSEPLTGIENYEHCPRGVVRAKHDR
jgi:hypothetical protein